MASLRVPIHKLTRDRKQFILGKQDDAYEDGVLRQLLLVNGELRSGGSRLLGCVASERGHRNLCGPLQPGKFPATLPRVSIQVNLPDDLVARIDDLSTDRSAFVAEAVRRALRETEQQADEHEIARINEVADELNREAEDVLEYQVFA